MIKTSLTLTFYCQTTSVNGMYVRKYVTRKKKEYIHTYYSRFILEGVVEAFQIFLRDAYVLPKNT
jgi:hypothetical protein